MSVGGDSVGGNIAHRMAILAGWDQLPRSIRLVGVFLAMPYFLGSNRVGLEPETITTSSNFKITYYINRGGPGLRAFVGLDVGG